MFLTGAKSYSRYGGYNSEAHALMRGSRKTNMLYILGNNKHKEDNEAGIHEGIRSMGGSGGFVTLGLGKTSLRK